MKLSTIVVELCACALTAPILLAGQSPVPASDVAAKRARMYAEIENLWQYQLKAHPEMATYVGDARYNDRLSDYSVAAFEREENEDKRMLALFESIDSTGFSTEDKLNRDLQIRSLRESIEQFASKDWEMPVNQMNGIHLDYAGMPASMNFKNVKDYQNYIARLNAIPRVFAEVIAAMRLGMKDRLMPPKYLLEKVGQEADGIARTSAEKSPFSAPTDHFPAEISESERQRLRAAILTAIEKNVNPAYAEFTRFVQEEYAPHGRTEYGVWSLPDGDARYRRAVKSETTTNLSPDEIHAMGLRQVTEIEAEMLKLAKSLGYQDLKSFNQHIRDDRDLYGKTGQQFFDLYKHYSDQMREKLPAYFGKLPPAPLEVVQMDAFRAPDAVPADYSPGTADGSRPGRINVNEYAPEKRLLLNVEAIAYHEGIPGHHLQFSIAQSLPSLPEFRKNAGYDAYSEGWALYSEKLGKEMGFYQDPYSEYGRLENEMWRSVRLVVDTGVHSKHWSRQQMIDFFTEHTAMDAQNIATETDRYIAWPGQALSYKLGQMTILMLREEARQQLGAGFDIRKFHDVVLEEGPLPLDLLQDHVHQWLRAQKTASGTQ